jgi:dTDP-4-dehydrorhamnose 3,5-epimerase
MWAHRQRKGSETVQVEATRLAGVYLVTPKRHFDERGFFSETWKKSSFAALGLHHDFVQDNQSLSVHAGVVRGLHFQAPPRAQDKLVRVVAGAIMDVVVDARVGSPSYGQWISIELSAENGQQLLIPKGFLHGFATLTDNCHVLYKCTDDYAAASDGAVHAFDPDLNIDWGLDITQATLSGKDAHAQSFAAFRSPFVFEG